MRDDAGKADAGAFQGIQIAEASPHDFIRPTFSFHTLTLSLHD